MTCVKVDITDKGFIGGTLKEYGRFLHINNKVLFLLGKFAVKCLKREF